MSRRFASSDSAFPQLMPFDVSGSIPGSSTTEGCRAGVIGAACYGRWCGGTSSRSQSSFDARRIISSSSNLSKSSGVTCTRDGFGAGEGGGWDFMAFIISAL